MKKIVLLSIIISGFTKVASAQDTVKKERFSFHFQQTIITQYKPAFTASIVAITVY
jgi:high affinity Mn2+ porin